METFIGITLGFAICAGIMAAGWATGGGVWTWLFFPIIDISALQFCLEYRIESPRRRLLVAALTTLVFTGLGYVFRADGAAHNGEICIGVLLALMVLLLFDRQRLARKARESQPAKS